MSAQTVENEASDRRRRRGASLALVASVVASALGGGVAGSAATLYAVRSVPAPQTVQPPVHTVALPAPAVEAVAPRPVADVSQEPLITQVFRQASPTVVSVSVGGPLGPSGRFRERGQGSGFVVDRSGLVLTNHHVVEGASRVSVRFSDGTVTTATVAGSDPGTDLAVLKAELPRGQAIATLGNSDEVEPGHAAIAIGSPFGLPQTVTAGIVSAVNRDWGAAGGRPMRGLIQTDAPVNPGNSGGPLLNLRGDVIGITTAIESPIRGSVGIGFAVPINEARRLLPLLARGERVEHPWLGISGSALTPELATQLGLSVQQGVLIHEVVAGGPAAQAGLRGGSDTSQSDVPAGGDVIAAVDGRAVKSVQELASSLDSRRVGDQVRLSVFRDGKSIELAVTLGAWPTGDRG